MRAFVSTSVVSILGAGVAAMPPGTVDGQNIPSDFSSGTLLATQTNTTGFGDQIPTDGGLTSGSELDQLYAANDSCNLYLGVTGNIETNATAVIVFIDSNPGGERILTGQGGDTLLDGMEGDALPLAPDDSVIEYDYAYVANAGASGTGGPIYVEWWDLQSNTSSYLGAATEGSGSGALAGGSNPNNAELGWNRGNVDGVIGCEDFDPACFFDAPAAVAAMAATATKGFEFAIPFADIGVTNLPATVKFWIYVTSGGFGSNQGLPSVRNLSPDMKSNAGNGPTDFTVPAFPMPNLAFDARSASYTALPLPAPVIVSANPPLDNPFVPGVQAFVDPLQNRGTAGTFGETVQGIGGTTTPNEGSFQYSTITAFVDQLGCPVPTGTVTCAFAAGVSGTNPLNDCPTVTSVAALEGAGPAYQITLSGPIPAGACTSITLAGVTGSLTYGFLPGDVSGNGTGAVADVLLLINLRNDGTCPLGPLPPGPAGDVGARCDTNRGNSGGAADVLRTVQLLNGVNTVQSWLNINLPAPCP